MPSDSVLGSIKVDVGGGAFTGNGGPTSSVPGGNGNGVDKAAKEQNSMLASIRNSAGKTAKDMGSQPRWWSKALKTMGIQMGIAGILKQSQIFTSTLGALFQILGAFVDIMLAPWIPIIVPGLRKLANQIPRMRVAAQKFFDFMMGKPVWIMQKIWGVLQKIFSRSWWTDTIKAGVASMTDFLPDFFDPLVEGIGGLAGKMGTVAVAISGLAATWAAAKLARYGLQATRWIPFVSSFTEPVRLLSKGVDKLFNKTASILGSVLGKAVDAILVRLGLKTAKVPVVTPDAPTSRPWGTEEMDYKPRTTRKPPGKPPGKAPAAPPPGKTPVSDPTVTPRGRGVINEMDEGFFKAAGRKPPAGVAKYTSIFDDTEWLGVGDEFSTRPAPGPARKFTPSGPEGGSSLDEINKMKKANVTANKFKDWVSKFLRTAGSKAAKGGSGIKSYIAEGFRLGGRALMESKAFGPILSKVAKYGVAFLKAVPFLGAAFMTGETTFDLQRMWKSDVAWTGDLTSYKAWEAEAKGWVAEMMGGGLLAGLPGYAGGAIGMGLSLMPGGIGDKYKETMKRWKDDQEAMGAISSGKAMDIGIRAITGYVGAGASFLPLIGQLAGGFAYEAGRYTTTGANVPFMGHLGTDKYGETEVTDWAIDKIVEAFRSLTGRQEISLSGVSAEMTGLG